MPNQFTEDVFVKVIEKGRHVDDLRYFGITFNKFKGFVILAFAVFNQLREGDQQRGMIVVLDQVPKLDHAGHPAIAVKIRMEIGEVEMDDGGFDNNAKIILGVDEADEFVHVLFQQTMLQSPVEDSAANDIDAVMAVIVARQ